MRFCPIDDAEKGSVTFCDFPNKEGLTRKPLEVLDRSVVPVLTWDEKQMMKGKILATRATYVICSHQLQPFRITGKKLFFVRNPRLAFMKILAKRHKVSGRLCDHVKVGRNVSVGAGTIIGGAGFGMWRTANGSVLAFPQIGTVVIEDNVEIHSNVCIDRGALGETRIGAGTKIDNLVHIAHNVKIGKDCVIVAHAMIGGSVVLGNRVWVGPSASLLNGICVGDDAVIGMGAIVLRNVEAGEKVHGVVK